MDELQRAECHQVMPGIQHLLNKAEPVCGGWDHTRDAAPKGGLWLQPRLRVWGFSVRQEERQRRRSRQRRPMQPGLQGCGGGDVWGEGCEVGMRGGGRGVRGKGRGYGDGQEAIAAWETLKTLEVNVSALPTSHFQGPFLR